MADEIEVIYIAHMLIRFQCFKVNPLAGQQFLNLLFLFLGCPLPNKVVEGSVCTNNIRFGVIDDALLPQEFPIRIIHRDRFIDYADTTPIFINNGLFFWWIWWINWVRVGIWFRSRRTGTTLFSPIIFINFNRAIPIRISKKGCNTANVHNYKMGLSIFFAYSCASSDNLLKLSH